MSKNYIQPIQMQRQLFLLILAILVPMLISAQKYVDAAGMGGIYEDEASSIILDSNKNVYMAGTYVDSVDFDPSSGVAIHRTVFGPNSFLAKYDDLGNYQWSVSIEGPQNIVVRDIAMGSSAYVYLIGDYMGTATFDANTTLTSNGVFDVFLAKYDSSGNFIWAKSFGGPAPDWGYSLSIDENENLYATGSFLIFTDFDASSGNFTLNTYNGSPDVFISKYDSSGNFVWAKQAGGVGLDEALSIETDRLGNLYLTGHFGSGTADFGGNSINSNGSNDVFIAKYDTNGNGIWAHGLGGPQMDKGTVLLLENNNLYIAGNFQDTAIVDSVQTPTSLISKGGDDIFLVRFDTAGNYIWATSIGGKKEDQAKDLGIDFQGNPYVTGFFDSSAVFQTGFNDLDLISQGEKDIFVAKYNPSSGMVIWAKAIGGTEDDASNAFASDDQYFYLAGYFSNIVDFNPSSGSSNFLTSFADRDIFKAKYEFCFDNDEVVYDTICSGESFLVTQTLKLMNPGDYRIELPAFAANSCDSILSIHLEVTQTNMSLSQNGSTISSLENQASFQWLDCTADTIIDGATNSSYTANRNGDYAVIITKNNCVDTSACINITTVGINELSNENVLELYPNPSNGKIFINSSENSEFSILNSIGEAIYRDKIQIGKNHFNLQLPSGLYFLRLENNKSYLKFMIE